MTRRSGRSRLPWGSLIILAVLLLSAIFANFIAPHDPLDSNLSARLQPPVFQGGTWSNILGTDEIGRDILSRLLFGARISLLLGGAALLIGAVIGVVIGLVAGYAGGTVDAVLMRATDMALSYPVILLALLLSVALGPRNTNLVIAASFILWARFARVVRGEVLHIKEQMYVDAARIVGGSPTRVLVRHILPNLINTLMILASLQMGWVILIEASLSYLGAGVPPPQPSWGAMAAQGTSYITSAWWVAGMPALAVMLAVLVFNLVGDWLRDRLDPRLQRSA
jgi:peptide/nickel transport system permease protein